MNNPRHFDDLDAAELEFLISKLLRDPMLQAAERQHLIAASRVVGTAGARLRRDRERAESCRFPCPPVGSEDIFADFEG